MRLAQGPRDNELRAGIPTQVSLTASHCVLAPPDLSQTRTPLPGALSAEVHWDEILSRLLNLRRLAEATNILVIYSKTLSCPIRPDWEGVWLGMEHLPGPDADLVGGDPLPSMEGTLSSPPGKYPQKEPSGSIL